MGKWGEKEESVTKLILWDENPRFLDAQKGVSQKDLINHLIRRYNLEEFAQKILDDVDLPQLEKVIIWDNAGKLYVLEGNRRVATYLAILDPELVEDEFIKLKFKEIQSKAKLPKNFKIECLVTKNKKQGLRYVDRKHLYRNNEATWGQQERDNYTKRTKVGGRLTTQQAASVFRADLGQKVRDIGFPEEVTSTVLGPKFVTNLFRIIGNTKMGPAYLGYKKNGAELEILNEKKFNKNLKAVVWNVYREQDFSEKSIGSRALNKTEDIEKYLKKVDALSEKKIESLLKKEMKEILTTPEAKKATPRSKPSTTTRSKLIGCTLKTPTSTKLTNIYRELKDNKLDDKNKYSTGVLFRTFIEITCEEYYARVKPTPKWNGSSLRLKVQSVIEDLDPKSEKDSRSKFHSIYNDVSDKKNGSIERLNKLTHDRRFSLSENDLKLMWDNLEYFFKEAFSKMP